MYNCFQNEDCRSLSDKKRGFVETRLNCIIVRNKISQSMWWAMEIANFDKPWPPDYDHPIKLSRIGHVRLKVAIKACILV